ncbi:MAG: hypothetical protein HYU97_06720 [Deltaproteobacteria bacterium]|nr:hypothetical protein [Deltaproteobacteria bacterium]
MKFIYKSSFVKAFDKLNAKDQELIIATDKLIKTYFETQKASFGLRIKKLHEGVFEARVNDKLRTVWIMGKDEVVFSLLGNHEDVRRFVKNL